jgi:hypothetical protein
LFQDQALDWLKFAVQEREMTTFARQLREEFDIPAPIAVWVVATHIFVLACPLALIWAIDVYGDLLPQALANATLIKIASAVYIGATAFEVAQNSADRWYLTEATQSVADCFFNSFMTLAFCLYTIGFYENFWMSLTAVILTIIYPFLYIKDHPAHRGVNGTVVMLGTVSLYLVTGDPVAFLFLVVTGLAVYFITFLIKQRAQWLHGWAAFLFGLAFLAWPWAIINAATGQTKSWLFAGVFTAVAGLLTVLMTPFVKKMKATPRQFS